MRRRQKPSPIRNKLDLSDRAQVRLLKKRLRLSESELTQIVGRIGNSISAISKEVSLQRASSLLQAVSVPSPEIISTANTDADRERFEKMAADLQSELEGTEGAEGH